MGLISGQETRPVLLTQELKSAYAHPNPSSISTIDTTDWTVNGP